MANDGVQIWHVYKCDLCRHAKPRQKDKYIAIVGIDRDGLFIGFIINSNLTPRAQKDKTLLVCQAMMDQDKHPFMIHDSIVDCSVNYPCELSDLSELSGPIHDECRENIIKAVEACEWLDAWLIKSIKRSAEKYQ